MKNIIPSIRHYIAFVILATSFFSCESFPVFTEPQPKGVKNLQKFPRRFQGQYISKDDSSSLFVTDSMILRLIDFDFVVQPDSNHILSGDTLIDKETNEKNMVRREGNEIVLHIHELDTLFYLNNDSNVIRKFKGYIFLNRRFAEGWDVQKLALKQGYLTMSSVAEEETPEKLQVLSESPIDTMSPIHLNPTKKQFKRFVREDGFNRTETFIKQ